MKRQIFVLEIIAMCIIAAVFSACDSGGEVPVGAVATPAPDEQPAPDVEGTLPIAVISTQPDVAVPLEQFTLDGSGSYDSDGGNIILYQWVQTGGSAVMLCCESEAVTTFEVPNETTTLVFALVVTDDEGETSQPATVEIEVLPTDTPPVTPSTPLTAVWVNAFVGSDGPENDGSYARPAATIGHGIDIAKSNGLDVVYVMQGSVTYLEEVHLESGIDVIGNVAGVRGDGEPIFATPLPGEERTVIQAPAGSPYAVSAIGVENVNLTGFRIIGAARDAESAALHIEDSDSITISGSSFETLGAAGAVCRDVEIIGSSDISILASKFENSGFCDSYMGVSIEDGDNVRIATGNLFEIENGGAEKYIKGVQAVGGSAVEISNSTIQPDASAVLGNDVVFGAIVISDVSDARIEDNTISASGGLDVTGVSLRCETAVVNAVVDHNTISFENGQEKMAGVKIVCPQETANFGISANYIMLEPESNVAADLRGIDATSLLRQVTLTAANNVITMPADRVNDEANKTALYLKNVGATSNVGVYFNNLLVTGKTGEMHAIYSDSRTLKIKAIDNVVLIFGANDANSVYSLRKACQLANCANEIETNLFNGKFFARNVKLVYYYDTGESEAMALANECDAPVPPPLCASGDVNRTHNVISPAVNASYFDLTLGFLLDDYIVLVVGNGTPVTGIDVDINGNPRGATPDIGAREY